MHTCKQKRALKRSLDLSLSLDEMVMRGATGAAPTNRVSGMTAMNGLGGIETSQGSQQSNDCTKAAHRMPGGDASATTC